MAWKTKSGQTSDAGQDSTRRGTEPQTGIHVQKSTEQQLQETQDYIARCNRIRSGDFWSE